MVGARAGFHRDNIREVEERLDQITHRIVQLENGIGGREGVTRNDGVGTLNHRVTEFTGRLFDLKQLLLLTKCVLKELIRVKCDDEEFPDVNKEGHSDWNKEMCDDGEFPDVNKEGNSEWNKEICDDGEFPDVSKEGHSEWNKEMPVLAYSGSIRNNNNNNNNNNELL